MTWTPDTAYRTGLDFFDDVVRSVVPSAWQNPSPCAGWTARDVLGHVGAAVRFGTALLRGEAPDWRPVEPPGQAVDGDPAGWWSVLVSPAREAVETVDLTAEVDSPHGRRTIGDGLTFPAIDLFIHGWDIATAGGTTVPIPAEAIEFIYRVTDGMPEGQLRSERVFGPAVTAPPNVGETERLVAWAGRDPVPRR